MNNLDVFSRLSRLSAALVPPPCESSELDAFEQSIAPFCLTQELRDFYSTCNGYYVEGDDPDTGLGFLSLARAKQEAGLLAEMLRSVGDDLPPALLPVFSFEGLTYLAVLGKEEMQESPIVSWHVEDGEMYLAYQSLRRFVETKLREGEIMSHNAYPGTDGHYPDRAAADAIQSELNPDAWRPEQQGNHSPSGVRNVYEFGALPPEWY